MSGIPSGPISLPAGTLAFIDDGYNEKGYIEALPGQYPAVRFTFRRMTTTEAKQYNVELRRLPDQNDIFAMNELGAKYLASHVVTWDIRKANGETVPIAVAFLAQRLKREVFGRLLQIVSGQAPSDMDPEWKAQKDEAEIASALGERTQETDEKNS